MASASPTTEKDLDIDPSSPSPASSIPSETSSQLDDTYAAYKNNRGTYLDPAEAKRTLRKIDTRIVPILFFTYLLQYLDKNGINYASAYGFIEGTHLGKNGYSWLGSIFYFGYLVGQVPSGYLLQRLPMAKFLGACTLGWGIVLMTTPACTNFAGTAANRFVLGLLESTVNPGFVLIMSMWYTSAEQPLRLEAYYCTNGIATMFGGLIGYAVGHIRTGLPRWMYVFLIFGSASMVMGIVTLLFLPDLPTTAKFLTERERVVAVERVSGNRQGVKNRHFKKYQAWQTLRDPKTWILFVMATGAQIPNSALTSFSSLIIKSFGVDTLGTQYLQIPGGAVQFLSLLAGGIICTHWPNTRCLVMTIANLICILGAALLVGLPAHQKWGRLVALWLCYFQGLGFSMSLTIVSSNVAGYTKKQLTGAILFTGYCVGNIIGPQTFKDSEKPGYHSAYVAMLVGYSVKLAAVLVLFAYMWSVNRKRDRESASGISGVGLTEAEEREAVEKGMLDVTEIDNKGFRYIL
ncbi:major facilitator superfamily domain-containing protein [Paraphoma chrysanthemicola]|uniref:Major facilitator superfamily domain-containing protein n=1 Tax=Paraphoma chrysanthemicola TaxID=798071 RepID=A0A8K0W4L9_9PLEO|nr:major facilitator superfamily domain-containing protein [Paraphoma chrysanthemicola]